MGTACDLSVGLRGLANQTSKSVGREKGTACWLQNLQRKSQHLNSQVYQVDLSTATQPEPRAVACINAGTCHSRTSGPSSGRAVCSCPSAQQPGMVRQAPPPTTAVPGASILTQDHSLSPGSWGNRCPSGCSRQKGS